MKGVILAAGRGCRIRNISNGKSKCLLKVDNKSIVCQNVKRLCGLGEVTECIIVVGYDAEAIMRDVGNVCNSKKITYCIQKNQKGLINALESAKWAIGDNDFFMVLGDEYFINNNYKGNIDDFYTNNFDCLIGIIKADNIEQVKKTYSFKIDVDGNMYSFVEKPVRPFNNYMGTGNVIFKNKVLAFLEDVPVNSKRGEKDLVDLFNLLLEKEKKIGGFIVGDAYFNVIQKKIMIRY